MKTIDNPKNGQDPGNAALAELVAEPELLAAFFTESKERYARAQEICLLLEKSSEDQGLVAELFRIIHTIKGECGFLKFETLGTLSHDMESLLVLLRDGKLSIDSSIIDVVLDGVDYSRDLLAAAEGGAPDSAKLASLPGYISTLKGLSAGVKPLFGKILLDTGKISEAQLQDMVDEQARSGFTRKLGEIAVERKLVSEEDIAASLEKQKSLERGRGTAALAAKTESVVKIKTEKVDFLVDMIGELAISLGQLEDASPAAAQARKISRSLQAAAMQLRTESIRNTFGNMKRIVRDTARKLGKRVEIETSGEDLEIDRNLMGKLEEPLMHIVRNSVDHGIEEQQERISAGKAPEGVLRLGAERRGNQIIISVSDDGRGLQRDKIVAKAVEKGLVRTEDAAGMDDDEIHRLIFLPGFSTKDSIDLVSGRGVGMDIVRDAVAKARGRIELHSEPGKGMRTQLLFPLTTASMEGLLIRLGGTVFVLPIASIVETMKLKPGMARFAGQGAEVVTIRGEILPLIRLVRVLGMDSPDSGEIGVVVEDAEAGKFVFLADEVIAKREIIMKSLGARFRDLRGVSSATILPGGGIGLILDVGQIIDMDCASNRATAASGGIANIV